MPSLTRRRFVRLCSAHAAALGLYPSFLRASVQASDDDVTFLTPGEDAFARHATPFNRRIKTRPTLIAVCHNERGVASAVRYAMDQGLRVAVKSGGHSFEGFSLNEDGLVVDVSLLVDQRLAGEAYTAGAGVRLAQAYDYLLPRGRLLPMGSCGGVGLSGLTLGGGYGMFARRWGLTCDHLTGVRMVDGRGEVRDSRDDGALLWACRGGGNGNFGVITEMRFDTRPAPAHLPRQRLRFRSLTAASAARLCERWFARTAQLPDDAFSAFVLNGSSLTVLITWFDPGSAAQIQRITDAMGRGADSVAEPANESLDRAVRRYYGAENPLHFKNASAGFYSGFHDLREGIEGVFQSVIDGSGLIFQINTLGGAIDDPDKTPTAAYPHRGLPYLGELQCYWERDSQTEHRAAQVDAVQRQLHDMGIDKHYRNYPSLLFEDWPTAYYGRDTYSGLQWCKNTYDPNDRIGHPQSVRG